MSQSTRQNSLIVILTAAVVILCVTCLIVIQTALAQDAAPHQNMRQLLESLNTRIGPDSSFQVTFKFVQPVMENGSVFWDIPYSSPDADTDRWIGEVGDDFVCFYEHSTDSQIARCTPFSNIISVNYKDQ